MKNSELEKIAARVFKANPTATKVLVAANGVAFVGENEHHAEVYAEQQRLALTTIYKTGAAPTDDAEELAALKEQLAVSDENLKTTQEALEEAKGQLKAALAEVAKLKEELKK